MGIEVIQITYDGTDLFASDGMVTSRFTKGAPGEPPMMRGEDDTIAAKTGRSPYPRVPDILAIGIFMQINAASNELDMLAAAELRRRQYLALFRTTEPKVLEALLPDGATATINALALPPVLVRQPVEGYHFEFDIALESVDPEWVITPAGS